MTLLFWIVLAWAVVATGVATWALYYGVRWMRLCHEAQGLARRATDVAERMKPAIVVLPPRPGR